MGGRDPQPVRLPTGGIELETLAAGPPNGPLVVLLHGFPEGAMAWRRQIGPLAAAGLRVLVPDQRGYARSDKPAATRAYRLDTLADDVLGLADTLGRATFSVVGHDWGGVVAWQLAARCPARIERAAILNAPHPALMPRYALAHPRQLLKSWYIAFFQLPGLPERLLRANGFARLRASLRGTSLPGTFTEQDLDRYAAAWAEPGALTGMLAWYRAMRDQRGGFRADRVRVPLRLIWGERDAFLNTGLARASLARCDAGDLVALPDAGHWLQHEQPARVSELLLAFVH
jgi:pimeloyl-ACP methyl ester carboxylesterase